MKSNIFFVKYQAFTFEIHLFTVYSRFVYETETFAKHLNNNYKEWKEGEAIRLQKTRNDKKNTKRNTF